MTNIHVNRLHAIPRSNNRTHDFTIVNQENIFSPFCWFANQSAFRHANRGLSQCQSKVARKPKPARMRQAMRVGEENVRRQLQLPDAGYGGGGVAERKQTGEKKK